MPQEITTKVTEQLPEGEIRPFDKVDVEFINSPYHKAGAIESVHPELAKKLIDKGVAKKPGVKTEKAK